MKYYSKLFIVYFPILLVSLQVAVNVLALVNKPFYYSIGFYLNTLLGTNVLFSFFLLALTFYFNFCAISRSAAIAEVLFGLNYLIVQQDNLYNILFQVIVGVIALLVTVRYYTRKFPKCDISQIKNFFKLVVKKKSCFKAFDEWELK